MPSVLRQMPSRSRRHTPHGLEKSTSIPDLRSGRQADQCGAVSMTRYEYNPHQLTPSTWKNPYRTS